MHSSHSKSANDDFSDARFSCNEAARSFNKQPPAAATSASETNCIADEETLNRTMRLLSMQLANEQSMIAEQSRIEAQQKARVAIGQVLDEYIVQTRRRLEESKRLFNVT